MSSDTRAAIQQLLESQSTLTLATHSDGQVWAAAVFFASDSKLNFYFVSDHRTRHARDMAATGRAAAAIHPDCATWGEVRGVQLEGRVEVLDGAARLGGLGHYLKKFPDVRMLFEKPRDPNEETIAARLKAANLYRLRPDRIRIIDNSRWFGFKEELELTP